MRRVISGFVASAVLVGCSVFGTSDPSPEEPGASPQENAQPPTVDGSPIPGVYVSASNGNDDATGTAARPLRTLKKAFALANEQHLRVIACAETYEESLTLIDGVSAYGYYECSVSPWKRGERRAIVQSPTSPAALAKGLRLPTRLEGFEVRAPDREKVTATGREGTSIALEVRDSLGLTISNCLLHSGKGGPGTDGAPAPPNAHVGSPDGVVGVDRGLGTCNAAMQICEPKKVIGSAGAKATCATGDAGGPGGNGGDGIWWSNVSSTEYPPATSYGKPLAAVAGVTALGGDPSGTGSGGAPGADGTDGRNGAWSFDAEGFVIGNGTAGMTGTPGQGGGGGGGARYYDSLTLGSSPKNSPTGYYQSSTGGGGGSGGCIGLASKPGTGGGASIGALVVASGLAVEGSRIETSDGGRAGRGYLGGAGVNGGNGGLQGIYAGRGGQGGQGGSAGISGHGAPGPSIALVYAGARPLLEHVDLAPGPGGAGWPEERLIKGWTTKVLPAVAGESKRDHEIKP